MDVFTVCEHLHAGCALLQTCYPGQCCPWGFCDSRSGFLAEERFAFRSEPDSPTSGPSSPSTPAHFSLRSPAMTAFADSGTSTPDGEDQLAQVQTCADCSCQRPTCKAVIVGLQQDEICSAHIWATQGSVLNRTRRCLLVPQKRLFVLLSSCFACSGVSTSMLDTHHWLQVVPSQETTPQLFGPRRHRTLAFPAGQGSSLLSREPTLAPPAAVPWEAEPPQVGGLSRQLLMASLKSLLCRSCTGCCNSGALRCS